ncbi:hypothetical protein OHB41_21200 [Streptomyces sp. NBC_01571]|uniref:hypothetical protein n=1 Tax=Streptomyces sp. NBC_01571 TaxID=2975883 RepID=UPI002252CB42|nr:hypothetical protein [Streptomyces sp. NBC_01571]MCX4575662.1 hypothetical protein [Streptomyces sp. NBC_01571]
MNAYGKVYDALTDGRPRPRAEVVQLLADLRREYGQELADAVEKDLDGQYRRADTDTNAEFRRKRQKYGIAMRTLALVREFASNPRSFTTPAQRDPRSTP